MEDLFPVIVVIIGAIGSILSSAKKSQEKKAAMESHKAAAAARIEAAQAKMAAAQAEQATAVPVITFQNVPGQVITPTVHTHVQPDCPTHDAPGSLGGLSPEGKDPCHEPMFARSAAAEPEQEEGGLTLDWSGENLVKAFVMQEVLTRPGNRTRRCAR